MKTLLILTLLISGCAGTFEEARPKTAAASDATRCHSLSERKYWFTGTSIASAAIAAASTSLVLPVRNESTDTALLLTGVGAGIVATGTGWFGANAGVDYVRECTK